MQADNAATWEDFFAEWCANEDLVEDENTPHGEAFFAGWELGYAHALRNVFDNAKPSEERRG